MISGKTPARPPVAPSEVLTTNGGGCTVDSLVY